MFGPAFNEAYSLKSKSAFYPRFILADESIIEIGITYYGYHPADDELHEKSEIKSMLSKDCDGFYYVNYINEETIQEITDSGKEYVQQLGDFISIGLEQYKCNLRVIQKYERMREKYNNLVCELRKNNRVEVAGLWYGSDKSDTFYRTLTQIQASQ